MSEPTPGPWKWKGEDYRAGWGWQLLVGRNGEGIICGADKDRKPYSGLRAHVPINPSLCKTGLLADENSAPAVHVRQPDARLIEVAPDLLAALEELCDDLQGRLDMATDGMTEADGLVVAEDANRSWRSWLFDVMGTHGDIARATIKKAKLPT